MLEHYIKILELNNISRCLAKVIMNIAYGLLLCKKPIMRQIALYLPVEGQKQSRVNRV